MFDPFERALNLDMYMISLSVLKLVHIIIMSKYGKFCYKKVNPYSCITLPVCVIIFIAQTYHFTVQIYKNAS